LGGGGGGGGGGWKRKDGGKTGRVGAAPASWARAGRGASPLVPSRVMWMSTVKFRPHAGRAADCVGILAEARGGKFLP
jgi:hypothetical protein